MILYYTDEEYRSKHSAFPASVLSNNRINMRALRIAEKNGLLYPFCRRFLEETDSKERSSLIRNRIREENGNLARLTKTLVSVQDLSKKGNFDFLFIKLYRGMPYAPRDVDILVRPENMHGILSLFRKSGFNVEAFSEVEIQCRRTDLLKVDLYGGFHYLSLPFISEDFLWESPRVVDIQGVDCHIPGFEADFLSTIIHFVLGHRYLSLLDFLYAKSLMQSKHLVFDKMLQETVKHEWGYAFRKIFSTLEDLYDVLYSNADFPKEIDFPIFFSTKFILEIFQGFADLPIGIRRKFLFILSAFFDAVYHEYFSLGQFAPIEIPNGLKNIAAKGLYNARRQRGDRKKV